MPIKSYHVFHKNPHTHHPVAWTWEHTHCSRGWRKRIEDPGCSMQKSPPRQTTNKQTNASFDAISFPCATQSRERFPSGAKKLRKVVALHMDTQVAQSMPTQHMKPFSSSVRSKLTRWVLSYCCNCCLDTSNLIADSLWNQFFYAKIWNRHTPKLGTQIPQVWEYCGSPCRLCLEQWLGQKLYEQLEPFALHQHSALRTCSVPPCDAITYNILQALFHQKRGIWHKPTDPAWQSTRSFQKRSKIARTKSWAAEENIGLASDVILGTFKQLEKPMGLKHLALGAPRSKRASATSSGLRLLAMVLEIRPTKLETVKGSGKKQWQQSWSSSTETTLTSK